MKKWETADGVKIPYNKLETLHLKNILRYIECRAEEGVDVFFVGGCWDALEPPYFDSDTIYGDEVYEHFDYEGLKNELFKRMFKIKNI